MRARLRLLGVGVSLALFLGVFAPAALAEPDLGLFQGLDVRVGEKPYTCTKDGGVPPTGRGLTFPQLKDVKITSGPNKDRVFRFTGDVQSVKFGAGFADICGFLTKVAGIGPRCGMTKGYNGKGFVRFPNAPGGEVVLKVSNVTWKVAPGTLLPITGRVHRMNAAGEKTKASRLYAVANVIFGGAACQNGWDPANMDRNAKGQGENSFIVAGVFVIDQSGYSREWKDITNKCAGWPGIDNKNDGKSSITNIWGDKKDKKPTKGPRPADYGPLPTCKG